MNPCSLWTIGGRPERDAVPPWKLKHMDLFVYDGKVARVESRAVHKSEPTAVHCAYVMDVASGEVQFPSGAWITMRIPCEDVVDANNDEVRAAIAIARLRKVE